MKNGNVNLSEWKIYHRNKALLVTIISKCTRVFFYRSWLYSNKVLEQWCDQQQCCCCVASILWKITAIFALVVNDSWTEKKICHSRTMSFRPTEDVLNQNPWAYAWPAISQCYLINIFFSFPLLRFMNT